MHFSNVHFLTLDCCSEDVRPCVWWPVQTRPPTSQFLKYQEMQSLSLTIFLPSPNNSHFPELFPTSRQHRDNFETTWWQLCDHWQSVTLPCGQHMAIFHVLSIPKVSDNGVFISDDIFSFKNISFTFFMKRNTIQWKGNTNCSIAE